MVSHVIEDISGRSCLYFPRLTVDEEGSFSDLSPGLVNWVCRATRGIPAIDEVFSAYEDCLKIDLLDALMTYQRPTDPIGNRNQQVGLYLILAHFMESVADERISCVSFYSSGAQAAYVFSGVFTIRQYLEEVLPLNNINRLAIARSEQELDLSEMLVRRRTPGPSLEKFLLPLIQEIGAKSEIFLKDKRGGNCCLLAGFRTSMENLRDVLQSYGDDLAVGRMKTESGAHIPVYETEAIRFIADKIAFRPPRCAIVGASGELVEKACKNEGELRSTFLDGVIGPLDTGAAMQTAGSLADRLIIIGTPFGARVLNSEIIQKFGRPMFPSELIIPLATLT